MVTVSWSDGLLKLANMTASVSLWLLAALCAQGSVKQVTAQGAAATRYNYPEFTGGYRAAGNALNAQPAGYAAAPAAAPATGPAPYNAAAVAAGYNYPEFTGGYPARRPAQAPAAYNPAPASYNTAPAAYNAGPAAYNAAPASYNAASAGGYSSAGAGGYTASDSGPSQYDNGPSQYDYGYASDTSAKQEVRSADGTVRGAYSYVDPNGQTQRVQYISDATGFHVVQGANLPKSPAPAPGQG